MSFQAQLSDDATGDLPCSAYVGASFVYDGDGKRVKATFDGVTTVYVGNHYEVEGSTVRKYYYYAGGQRVAMREDGTLHWLLGDHLGSTAIPFRYAPGTTVTADASGNREAELRY